MAFSGNVLYIWAPHWLPRWLAGFGTHHKPITTPVCQASRSPSGGCVPDPSTPLTSTTSGERNPRRPESLTYCSSRPRAKAQFTPGSIACRVGCVWKREFSGCLRGPNTQVRWLSDHIFHMGRNKHALQMLHRWKIIIIINSSAGFVLYKSLEVFCSEVTHTNGVRGQ